MAPVQLGSPRSAGTLGSGSARRICRRWVSRGGLQNCTSQTGSRCSLHSAITTVVDVLEHESILVAGRGVATRRCNRERHGSSRFDEQRQGQRPQRRHREGVSRRRSMMQWHEEVVTALRNRKEAISLLFKADCRTMQTPISTSFPMPGSKVMPAALASPLASTRPSAPPQHE